MASQAWSERSHWQAPPAYTEGDPAFSPPTCRGHVPPLNTPRDYGPEAALSPGAAYHDSGTDSSDSSVYVIPVTYTVVSTEDGEDVIMEMNSFEDKAIRRGFMKRVFGVLTIQLLITLSIVCIIYFVPVINEYVRWHFWVWITFMCLAIISLLPLEFCNLARKWPVNFICLIQFTVFESIMLGSIMVYFSAVAVGMAFGTVFIVVLFMFLLGFQQKVDLTPLVGILGLLTLCLLMSAFWGLTWGWTMSIVWAFVGAILFSLASISNALTFLKEPEIAVNYAIWLFVDIQLVIGGERSFQIDPEEYIFAAVIIYLDIINLLLFILLIIALMMEKK